MLIPLKIKTAKNFDMLPVRCFSCNRVLKTVYDEKDFNRLCCNRMFLGHVDFVDTLIQYPPIEVECKDK